MNTGTAIQTNKLGACEPGVGLWPLHTHLLTILGY